MDQDNTIPWQPRGARPGLESALGHRIRAGRFAGRSFAEVLATESYAWSYIEWLATTPAVDADAAGLVLQLSRWRGQDETMRRLWRPAA